MKTSKRRLVPRRSGPTRDQRGTTTKRGVVPNHADHAENPTKSERYAVELHLRNLLNSKGIPASARVHAARTLAEIEGLIGRHQVAPERNEVTPLAGLSRDQLIDELERLRTAVDLGLVT